MFRSRVEFANTAYSEDRPLEAGLCYFVDCQGAKSTSVRFFLDFFFCGMAAVAHLIAKRFVDFGYPQFIQLAVRVPVTLHGHLRREWVKTINETQSMCLA